MLEEKIERLFAFVAEDGDDNGNEGIMAFFNPTVNMAMPMVGADMARVSSLLPIAKEISKQSGKPFRVIMFEGRRDVTQAVLEGKNFG